MVIHLKKISFVFFVALFITIVNSSVASAGAILSDLENQLMCKCDDKCGKVLINCTCSTADKNRKKFTKMLESGLTVDQIVQQQIEKYVDRIFVIVAIKERSDPWIACLSIFSPDEWSIRGDNGTEDRD